MTQHFTRSRCEERIKDSAAGGCPNEELMYPLLQITGADALTIRDYIYTFHKGPHNVVLDPRDIKEWTPLWSMRGKSALLRVHDRLIELSKGGI